MKNKILFLAILSAASLFSCKNTSDKNVSVNPVNCTEYACPMHPDHTSTVAAKCPVCNMQMEALKDTTGKDSTRVH